MYTESTPAKNVTIGTPALLVDQTGGASFLGRVAALRPVTIPIATCGPHSARACAGGGGRGLHEAALSVLVSSSTCGGEARREEGRER